MKLRHPASLVFSMLVGVAGLAASSTTATSRGCNEFVLPSAFSIRQSNGPAVTIRLSADRRGNVTGSAAWGYPRKIGEIRQGSFDGRVLSFRINWSAGHGSGNYEGSINQRHKFIGVVRGGGVTARFESIQQFECFG